MEGERKESGRKGLGERGREGRGEGMGEGGEGRRAVQEREGGVRWVVLVVCSQTSKINGVGYYSFWSVLN